MVIQEYLNILKEEVVELIQDGFLYAIVSMTPGRYAACLLCSRVSVLSILNVLLKHFWIVNISSKPINSTDFYFF